MPKYRIRAYCHTGDTTCFNEYKVQQKCWWGWKTVAKGLGCIRRACDIVRELKIAHDNTENE